MCTNSTICDGKDGVICSFPSSVYNSLRCSVVAVCVFLACGDLLEFHNRVHIRPRERNTMAKNNHCLTWKAVNCIINAQDNIDTFFNILHFSPGDSFTFSLIETVSSVLRSGGWIWKCKDLIETFFSRPFLRRLIENWLYLNWVVAIVTLIVISWAECHFYMQSGTKITTSWTNFPSAQSF